ncbi:hypothetical protein BJ912DRAFT_1142846, partial [Pholiota molesta]
MKTLLLWAAAKNNPPRIPSKISESLVFPTPDVEDAASYLANAIHITRPDGENVLKYTPLKSSAARWCRSEDRKILTRFLEDDQEQRKTVEAARGPAGDIEELGRMLEHSSLGIILGGENLEDDKFGGDGQSNEVETENEEKDVVKRDAPRGNAPQRRAVATVPSTGIVVVIIVRRPMRRAESADAGENILEKAEEVRRRGRRRADGAGKRELAKLLSPRPRDLAVIFTLGRKRTTHLRAEAMGLSASSRCRYYRVAHMRPSMRVMKQALAAAEIPAEASIRAAATCG